MLSFVMAAILGTLLRFAFVAQVPSWLQYKYIQHAHSHVAMMGWLYSGLFILIVHLYGLRRSVYSQLFWWTQVSVLGMLISFPIQGYGAVSIGFSTSHMLLSYVFTFQVFRDLRQPEYRGEFATLLLKSALIFLVVSTLGTWALGGIMNSPLRGTAWYYGAIQFFLHFQFNGWFSFAVLALFFRSLYLRKIPLPHARLKGFYRLLVVSCVLTFALAVTWSTPDNFLFWTNSLGVVLQMGALIALFIILSKIFPLQRSKLEPWTRYLWTIAFCSFSLKMIIQTLVAIPYLATISYTIRNFVIGFVHLLMLGAISTFILGGIHEMGLRTNTQGKIGVNVFIAGFLLTECLLFLQGLMVWQEMGFMTHYHLIIFMASLLLPLGLIYYLIHFSRLTPTTAEKALPNSKLND